MATNNSLKSMLMGLAVADTGGGLYALKISSYTAFAVALVIDVILVALIAIMEVPTADLPSFLDKLQEELDSLSSNGQLMAELNALSPELTKLIQELLTYIEETPTIKQQIQDELKKLSAMTPEQVIEELKKIKLQ